MTRNRRVVSLPSATRSTDQTLGPFKNPECKGIEILVNVTSLNGGAPSFTVEVDALDEYGNNIGSVLKSAAFTTVTARRLVIYPGITASANVAASMVMPQNYQIFVDDTAAANVDYSLVANLLY